MRVNSKRGLSPIVATILLIALAVIIAVIIFLWARSVISEKIEKLDEPIERFCDQVALEASATGGEVTLVNRGNIPIYGVKIFKETSLGSTELDEESGIDLLAGLDTSIAVDGIQSGDEIIVVPILLGETGVNKKPYVCDSDFGVSVNVG